MADSDGFFVSDSEDVKTSYDLTFGRSEFDSRPALGRCVKQHTFKDAVLPDGKPNPKPQVVDEPGWVWPNRDLRADFVFAQG